MGDRGNIAIVQHGPEGSASFLYFYAHWHGYRLPKMLKDALKTGVSRQNDEPYLARIIFCEMMRHAGDPTTGFGITTYLTDQEYPLLVVDVKKQTVSATPATEPHKPYKTMTFRDFCLLEGDDLLNFRKP